MGDETTAPVKLSWIDYVKMLFNGRAAVQQAMLEGKLVLNEAHKSGVRTLAFWMTVLASGGAVAAQVGGLVPPPYGAVILAASPLLYAISRGLKKRDDELGGVKPALATSEAWVNIIAAAGQLSLAASHGVSPELAATLTAVHAGAIAIADSLAKSGAQPQP